MSKFQSISLPTLSDSATMKEVENESRKMGLDILNKLNAVSDAQYPVGATYTQYSGQTAPALLFGGTWTDITATSLPTQIYDSGSNANGNWIRYTDGTMQQWGYVSSSAPASVSNYFGTTSGTVFWSTQSLTFPIAFVGNIPSVSVSHSLSVNVSSATFVTLTTCVLITENNATFAGTKSWSAIGEWSSAPVYPVTLWKRTGGSLTTTTGTSVVTGIYDSGTDSNGSWIRFTDGTMMQWGKTTPSSQVFAASGTVFASIGPVINYPLSFVDINYSFNVFADQTSGNDGIWCGQRNSTNKTISSNEFYFWRYASGTITLGAEWTAMGKWK